MSTFMYAAPPVDAPGRYLVSPEELNFLVGQYRETIQEALKLGTPLRVVEIKETKAQNGFKSNHFTDNDGNPAGGTTYGTGFSIAWQNGQLGRGEERQEPNGAFVEDVILAVYDRLVFYQNSRFNCVENRIAMDALNIAIMALESRTKKREDKGVEGTHEV